MATKPSPPDDSDRIRWAATSLRRKVLYGEHGEDVKALMVAKLNSERARAMKGVDLSVNLAEQVCGTLSAMYLDAPWIDHPTASAEEISELNQVLSDAQLWPLMDRQQRDTLGLREMLLHLDVSQDGALTPRMVFPDCVVAAAGADGRSPVSVSEVREREIDGVWRWCWDVLKLGHGATSYRVLTSLDAGGDDVTAAVGVDASAYAYADGSPFLPYVMYRAAYTGGLWSPHEWAGLFSATMMACVFRTGFGHGVLQASWAQRWIANGRVKGATASRGQGVPVFTGSGDSATAEPAVGIVTDPASLLELETGDQSDHPIQVGQFAPPVEPGKILTAIVEYCRTAVEAIGIDPAAVQRASDPRSGIALVVSRDAQREAQKQWMPVFRASDLEMVSKVVALRNRVLSRAVPETGWTITYRSLPPTESELAAKQARVLDQLDRGLMTRQDAFIAINPGVTESEAAAKLAAIDAERNPGVPSA